MSPTNIKNTEEDDDRVRSFDREMYDKEYRTAFFTDVQRKHGCYHTDCRAQGASQKCSACGFAVYCNRNCQKLDWKAGHKDEYAMYRENRKLECVPLSMYNTGWISNECFEAMVEERLKLFLAIDSGICDMLHIGSSVIDLEGNDTLRQTLSFRFYDCAAEKVHEEGRFIMKVVDEGRAAKERLYQGVSGSLSVRTKRKAVKNLIRVLELAQYAGKTIISVTFGRGLVELAEKDSDGGRQLNRASGNGDLLFLVFPEYEFKTFEHNIMKGAMEIFGRT